MAQSAAAVALAETPTHSCCSAPLRSVLRPVPAHARVLSLNPASSGLRRIGYEALCFAAASQSSPRLVLRQTGGSAGRAALVCAGGRDDLKLATSTERASLRRQWRAHAARRSARRPARSTCAADAAAHDGLVRTENVAGLGMQAFGYAISAFGLPRRSACALVQVSATRRVGVSSAVGGLGHELSTGPCLRRSHGGPTALILRIA